MCQMGLKVCIKELVSGKEPQPNLMTSRETIENYNGYHYFRHQDVLFTIHVVYNK